MTSHCISEGAIGVTDPAMGPWSIRKIPDRGVPRAAQRLGPESRSGPRRCGLLCDGNREGTREAGLPSPRPASSARKRSPPQISRTCAIRSCITACLSAYQSTGGSRLSIQAETACSCRSRVRAPRRPASPDHTRSGIAPQGFYRTSGALWLGAEGSRPHEHDEQRSLRRPHRRRRH